MLSIIGGRVYNVSVLFCSFLASVLHFYITDGRFCIIMIFCQSLAYILTFLLLTIVGLQYSVIMLFWEMLPFGFILLAL